MLVRVAVPEDVDVILAVVEPAYVTALPHVYPQDRYPFPREQVRARWAAELADPAVGTHVAVDPSGEVVGVVAVRAGELLHLASAPPTWGRDVATALHDTAVSALLAGGHRRAELQVLEENHRARRFYGRRGWSATGDRGRSPSAPHPVLLTYDRELDEG